MPCDCGALLQPWSAACPGCGLLTRQAPAAWTAPRAVLELDPGCGEAREVAAAFHADCPDSHVVQVLRVQAVELFEALELRQRQLRRRGAPHRATHLWHGTSKEAAEAIVEQGFNRAFSKRARLGKGVYFARSARYSALPAFARPDVESGGDQFLILSLVCVGVSGSASPSPFDSVVDEQAGVVAVFHDAAALPLYVLRVRRPPEELRLPPPAAPVAPPAAGVGSFGSFGPSPPVVVSTPLRAALLSPALAPLAPPVAPSPVLSGASQPQSRAPAGVPCFPPFALGVRLRGGRPSASKKRKERLLAGGRWALFGRGRPRACARPRARPRARALYP